MNLGAAAGATSDRLFRAAAYLSFGGMLAFQWLFAIGYWLGTPGAANILPVQIAFFLICLAAPGSWRGAATARTRRFGRRVVWLSLPPMLGTLLFLAIH